MTDRSLQRNLLLSLLIACSYFLLLIPYTAYWGTNDDVRLAMLAGGFGIAESPTVALLHSNVVWGWLASQMPSIGSIAGYTLLSYSINVGVITALLFALLMQRIPIVLVFAAVLMFAASLLIYPQFTKTAGLAAVAAVALVVLYERTGNRWLLLVSVALVLIGFWVRSLEALLVVFVALPFLPFTLIKDKALLAAGVFVVAVATVTTYLNWNYYQTDVWQAYLDLDLARLPFTDYGATALALSMPEVLRQQGFSMTDVVLVGNWFFVDRSIADPERLRLLLDSLPTRQFGIDGVLAGISAVTNLVYMLPLVFASLLVLILKPGWKTSLAWLLFLLVVSVGGFVGRPFPARVLLPLYALLFLIPMLLSDFPVKKFSHPAAIGVLAVCLLGQGFFLWQAQKGFAEEAVKLEEVASLMQEQETAVWGQTLFIDNLYRPANSYRSNLNYYELAEMTHLPNSYATYLEQQDRGFVERLLSESGLRLLTRDNFLPVLAGYCHEHHSGQLLITEQLYVLETRGVRSVLNTVKCQSAVP